MPRAIVTQEAVFVVADHLVAAGQDSGFTFPSACMLAVVAGCRIPRTCYSTRETGVWATVWFAGRQHPQCARSGNRLRPGGNRKLAVDCAGVGLGGVR
jgi:hypothetical protein